MDIARERRDQAQGQTLSNRDTRRCFPPRNESAGDRHSSPLPKSGSGVVSGTCVGMAGFFLFFSNFLTDLLLSDKCPE